MPSSLIVPGGRPEVQQPAQPDPNTPVEVVTAFVVYQRPSGNWGVAPLDHGDLKVRREVTFDDITAGSANMLDYVDILYPEGEVDVVTAFVVFQLPTGLWQLTNEVSAPLIPQRPPIHADVLGGLTVTMRDIHIREGAQQTAQATINAQFQVGQAIAEQRQSAQMQQQLAAEKDKLRRGGR